MTNRFYPLASTIQQCRQLLALGYDWIQFRKKQASHLELEQLTTLQIKYPQQKIILNDDANAAIRLQLSGVHLGQTDLQQQQAIIPQLRRQGLLFGISTHCQKEVVAALQLRPSYIAIGPIFSSRTKPDLLANPINASLNLLGKIKNLAANIPVVAIGGIDEHNAKSLLDAGFDRVAFARLTERLCWQSIEPSRLLGYSHI